MKNKKKIFGASILVILITFVLVALFFNLQTQGQELSYPTSAGEQTELTTGAWMLTDISTRVYNSKNITTWNSASTEITGECSWKDILDIVHTVNIGFKWEEPPKMMPPGKFLSIQADYVNNEYSTPCKVVTRIKMFIDRIGTNHLASNPDAIEIMKVTKDNKQNKSEVKKGFFTAPKTLFDETNQCELTVDCFVGQDHFVTKYLYTYQQ